MTKMKSKTNQAPQKPKWCAICDYQVDQKNQPMKGAPKPAQSACPTVCDPCWQMPRIRKAVAELPPPKQEDK